MELFLKRFGYFVGGIFLLNIVFLIFDNLVTYSPKITEEKLEKLDKKNLKKKELSNNKDSEYMKIIGDYKWTDNLRTWRKRFPLCPMTYKQNFGVGGGKNFRFPNQYPDGAPMSYDPNGGRWNKDITSKKEKIIIEGKSDDYMKENCTLKIGGLNLQILRTGKFQFRKGGSAIEIDDLMTHFLKGISFRIDSQEDRYLLYRIFKDKYNECKYNPRNNCFESQYSEYTLGDGLSDLSIKTTTKSNKVLQELSEQIYRLQIDTNRLDPSEF